MSGVSIRGLGLDDLIKLHICEGFEVEEKGNWNGSQLINSDHILPLQLPPRERKRNSRSGINEGKQHNGRKKEESGERRLGDPQSDLFSETEAQSLKFPKTQSFALS